MAGEEYRDIFKERTPTGGKSRRAASLFEPKSVLDEFPEAEPYHFGYREGQIVRPPVSGIGENWSPLRLKDQGGQR